ncbi:LysM peptidoglycan-binding domain-containing protein [Conyzicola sp.]|uniref:LysM peptidoglycan-binding domain-containing protein n=1 Tax=Conyzicola sp. TaxID=1969404 RepID=UPI0039895847
MKARHLLAPVVALALLAGCTVVEPEPRETDADLVAGQTSEPTPAPVVLDVGTVVATGALVSADGLTTGDVRIVAARGRDFQLKLDNFISPPGTDLIPNLSAEPFTEAAYCDGGFMMFGLENFTPTPGVTSDLHFRDITFGNPAFLDTLVITLNDGNAPRTGCFYPVVATASLVWTMPDLRPDIRVVDSGITGGASGEVTENRNGLSAYEVAAGDVLAEIAARFGISVLDLFYLNPARDKGQQRLAFAGEVLNLDKAGR